MILDSISDKVVKIYLSFSNNDSKLADALIQQLNPLQRRGLIEVLHQGIIKAGSDIQNSIKEYINCADIILLLLSPDFVMSEHCCIVERRAMERYESESISVIPIILRPFDWKTLTCSKFQCLPSNSKPVTLWKSREAAFSSIVEGIKKVIIEITALISPSGVQDKTSQFWNIPYRRNPFFTGREALLAQLYNRFNSTTVPVQEQILTGLGGIGKTQIVVEYAYQYAEKYQTVLWLHTDSSENLTSSLVQIASMLKLPKQNETNQRIIHESVKRWLQQQKNWLLVFDNVEDFSLVNDFLPLRHKGHVIITTQSEATGSFAHTIDLRTMEPDEGALLFLRRAKVLPTYATLSQASQPIITASISLSQLLGGLPLALEQAGAYIDETRTGVADYLELYKKQSKKLLRRRGRGSFDYPQSVTATFTLAFEKVQQEYSTSAELIKLFSFLHPDDIPENLLREAASDLGPVLQKIIADPLELDTAIEGLLKFSLVQRSAETKALSIHRLVQTVLRDILPEDQRQQWAGHVVQILVTTFPESEFATWEYCQRYLAHAQVATRWIEQWQLESTQTAHFLRRVGLYLCDRGEYIEAKSLLQYALAIQEKVLDPGHPDIASSLEALGILYRDQGKYKQAETPLLRAFTILEQTLGADHLSTASTLNILGLLYFSQGRYEKAQECLQRALAIREKVLDPESIEIASSLNNLSGPYSAQGNYTQAEALLRRALEIYEKSLGVEHPRTAYSLSNLATLYEREDKYEIAESLFRRVLSIREQAFGTEHPSTAYSIYKLGELYLVQARYEAAETFLLRSLELRERVLGPDHPDTANSLSTLGAIYRQQNRYEQAESLFLRSLELRERVLGPGHPDIAASLDHIGELYLQQGQYEQADTALRKSLAIREQAFNGLHPRIAQTLYYLARLCQEQGQHMQAKPFLKRALEIDEQMLGPEHPETILRREQYHTILKKNEE